MNSKVHEHDWKYYDSDVRTEKQEDYYHCKCNKTLVKVFLIEQDGTLVNTGEYEVD